MFIAEITENTGFFEEFVALLKTYSIYFADQDADILVGALFALPKRVIILHDHDHLFWHIAIIFSELAIINF